MRDKEQKKERNTEECERVRESARECVRWRRRNRMRINEKEKERL